MSSITIRILDGPDKGRVFKDLPLPTTIGRENGNSVQLNDERVSRFHVRIQKEGSEMFIADLNSTNGTRINGEHVQLATLHPGDCLILGRTILLIGTRDEIAKRLCEEAPSSDSASVSRGMLDDDPYDLSRVFAKMGIDSEAAQNGSFLKSMPAPELPTGLTPLQRAQLSELLQYYLLTFRHVVELGQTYKGEQNESNGQNKAGAQPRETSGKDVQLRDSVSGKANDTDKVVLPLWQWQMLLSLYARTTRYLNQIGEPDN